MQQILTDQARSQLTQELDNLTSLLSESIPANPRSPKNQRRANRLERTMQRYFKALEQGFPYEAVEQLYYRYVKEE